MAYTGEVIENPVSGERITFRRTSADTNGELLEFDVELPLRTVTCRGCTFIPPRLSASRCSTARCASGRASAT